MLHGFATSQQRAVCSKCNDDPLDPSREQFFCTFFCLIDVSYRHSRDGLGFTFVGHEIVETSQSIHVGWLSGGRVDDAANAILACKTDAVIDGFERNFELQDDAIDGFEQVGGGLHVRGLKQIVRAFDHPDAILPVRLHKNWRHSTGHSFDRLYVGGIDSKFLEILNGRRTE